MDALHVAKPDVLTRVTEYVDPIIDFVQRIIDRGYAYASNGSVYFDTLAFEANPDHKYGKLRETALADTEEAMDGEGALAAGGSEKKNDADFVLWKKSKAGEPKWDSPWGPGRPGWHIECSAMCSDLLGGAVDINGGGVDLAFPHHENQLAQSEAYWGTKQWVNFFLHTGHLHIDGLKMSKSLKNFITIRAALSMYTARQLRFLFLLAQWSEPMELTPVAGPDGEGCTGFAQMEQACQLEKTFSEFFHAVKGELRKGAYSRYDEHVPGPHEKTLQAAIDECRTKVHDNMLNNIYTPGVVLALQGLVRATNSYLAVTPAPRRLLLLSSAQYVTRILDVLGVGDAGEKVGFADDAAGGGREEVMGPALDVLVQFRDQVRSLARAGASAKELLAACDKVRDSGLPPLGVRLDDREQGALWKLYDPAELQKEMALEADAKAAKEAEARKRKEEAARKAADKEAKARIPPSEMFKQGEHAGKFTKFDDRGVPTHDDKGEEIPKGGRKKLEKLYGAQQKLHEAQLAKDASGGGEAAKRGGKPAGGGSMAAFPTAQGGEAGRWCPTGTGDGTHMAP